jgi:hypothetical protein
MRARVVTAAVVAGAIGAALFAMAADREGGPDAAPESQERVGSPSSAQDASAGAPSSAPAPTRARVPAGVLARAASRRAQDREAAGHAAPERRRGREQGDVISVEIDWHAGAAADR